MLAKGLGYPQQLSSALLSLDRNEDHYLCNLYQTPYNQEYIDMDMR